MDSINVANPTLADENLNTMVMDIHLISQDPAKVLNFLMSLPTIAPILTIGEIEMEKGQGGEWTSGTKISIYWSGLPATLPPIDEPVNDLTSKEKAILNQVSSLTIPTFTILEPTSPKDRLTPFN